MEDLRFYDFEFNLLCTIPDIFDVCWEIKFNGIGNFEAGIIVDEEITKKIMEHEYIVVVQGRKQAIVTEKFFEDNKLTIYGRTVNFILSKRVVMPFNIKYYEVDNKGFRLIESLVKQYFPEIEVSYSCEDEEIDFYRLVMYDLEEIICDILERMRAGHRVVYDIKNKKWVLELFRERETNLFLSEDNKNIYNSTYTSSILDYANCGVYKRDIRDCGDWNADKNDPPLSMGLPENIGKLYRVSEDGIQFSNEYTKGGYIACITEDGNFIKTDYITEYFLEIQTDKQGFYKWESKLSGNSRKEAEKSLATKNKENNIKATVRELKFEKDYNLGDVLRIQKRVGGKVIDGKRLVSSVQIWYTSRECGEMPSFKEV